MKETIPNEIELIIRRLAWNFIQRTNSRMIEYEDLVQEGILSYYRAMQTFDPNRKVRLTTWIWINVKNTLIDFLQKYTKEMEDIEYLEDFLSQSSSMFDFEDFLNGLTNKAREICEFVVKNDTLFTSKSPRGNRGLLYKKLREQGWKWNDIWNSFNEIKLAL